MTSECIFCQIAAGQVPADKVYESPISLAFRDLDPQAPQHLLVIPKQHVANADELGPEHAEILGDLFATATQAARAVGVSPQAGGGGYRLVFNVGADANNTVPHLHLHVLGGRQLGWPPG